ncbi:co-chaperone DjlA [Aliidiomarina taiwanensis]|uniref:Co-chaperone DjlA n=1 Tax=Aliidiomarina taiwanensis TaxID=946228 RepID=A0A432X1A6_9GAMM|nr:co-chaperone DjlA [Aliidiomarina taiwanensis]RUO40069.1 co-chaperone DjlA [Aliidiomarina taiwanensis]
MWGRVVGAAFGFIFGKLPGAVLGFAIGYWFDWKYGAPLAGQGGLNRFFAKRSYSRQDATFFYALFAAHGHIAKTKGRISEADIASAQGLMDELGLKGAALEEARAAFREGKDPHFPLVPTLKQFRRDYDNRSAVLQSFMLQLIALLIRAHRLQRAEFELLLTVAKTLGYTRFELERWLLMESAQLQFKRFKNKAKRPQPAAENKQLKAAYTVLGVTSEASDEVIKKAYRRLMAEHHPDKLAAQGLPEEMLAGATRRTQEIQAAYNLIKQHRR